MISLRKKDGLIYIQSETLTVPFLTFEEYK